MPQIKCNILLMGITGVGKSALVNYLAGKNLAKSGIGEKAGGVTRGINKYELTINGQQCLVSDTEGLEVEKADFWRNMMERELSKSTLTSSILNCYHIVVYCIGANLNRVQDFELEMLKKIQDTGYGIIVAFTKADMVSDEDITNLKDCIEQSFEYSNFEYVSICTKKGRSLEPWGKDEISKVIVEQWKRTLFLRLPENIYDWCFNDLDEWCKNSKEWIYKQEIDVSSNNKESVLQLLNEKINRKITNISSRINKKLETALSDIRQVYAALNLIIDIKQLELGNTDLKHFINPLTSDNVFYGSTKDSVWVSWDKKRNYEIAVAFNDQYESVLQVLSDQREIFQYELEATQGDSEYQFRLGQAFLFGNGVEYNFGVAADWLKKASRQGHTDAKQLLKKMGGGIWILDV